MIIGVSEDGTISPQNRELYAMLKEDFFDFRESQWPDGKTTAENLETGFPWMSWQYPQKNFNGMMSVSLAQHPDAKMSNGPLTNNGRGFDYKKMRNYTSNSDKGTNYQGQWETVFENNADSSKKYVDQVLVTGFNEWMAIKLNDGNDSYFVDTFSEEYSRDIEMMKGGYGDNFVVQTLINTRKYKYSEAKPLRIRSENHAARQFHRRGVERTSRASTKTPSATRSPATTATRFRPPLTWITATATIFLPSASRTTRQIYMCGWKLPKRSPPITVRIKIG